MKKCPSSSRSWVSNPRRKNLLHSQWMFFKWFIHCLFLCFFYIQLIEIEFADDWIQTTNLWCWKQLLYAAQKELIVLRWAIPCLFFLIFRLFCKQLTVNNNNDWIRTWILWNHWQLRHNQCSVVSVLPTLLRSEFTFRILFRTQTVLLVKFLPQIFTFNWNIS